MDRDTNIHETTNRIYAYLERITNLVRAEERALCTRHNLQPIQLRMLRYLGTCNRYSNTPAGVAAYVQLTKGTVSQSLKALEAKGFIKKQVDRRDKRQVHLLLTESGRTVLAGLPPAALHDVSLALGEMEAAETARALHRYLLALQRTNQMHGFGVCQTCRYHQAVDAQHFRCGLTDEVLTRPEAELICREHIWPGESSSIAP